MSNFDREGSHPPGPLGQAADAAMRLGTASGTAKIHVQNILSKLDATDRTRVVTIALRRGIIHL